MNAVVSDLSTSTRIVFTWRLLTTFCCPLCGDLLVPTLVAADAGFEARSSDDEDEVSISGDLATLVNPPVVAVVNELETRGGFGIT